MDSLGEAYVAPSTLNLRRELALKSPVAATVKHGEKLEIVEYRHRLVRVRTGQGVEGWTDMRQLLTPDQMSELEGMAKDASRALSQGQATVFETLNMHTAPNRVSPSFAQIPENGKVDVIAHKLTPRVQREEVVAPAPVKTAPVRKKKAKAASTKIGPPARPPVPKVPENWVALSVPKLGPEPPPSDLPAPGDPTTKQTPAQPAAPPAPVAMDDWDLVRTQDGKVGWVLERPLSMAIPDEVAQYAEGHRITSYFPLGQVRDGDTVKNNWLWTTIIKGGEPYEYDSFRVFVWSIRHHRYETAYVERNIVGHYPVTANNSATDPSFSVIVEGVDGHWYRKTYSFDSYRIHMTNRELYDPSKKPAAAKIASSGPAAGQSAAKRSWYASLKDRVHRFLR
ncbi:MAG TPA: SH3 domain-containing protein [Bryobacteraceae bacterium]|nr:SH3 domain-containing protein [Bryobacteraceae bacterium]